MLGHLYDRALGGERCWVRHEDGEVRPRDVFDDVFGEAVTQMCTPPMMEPGCWPGRLVARLIGGRVVASLATP